MAAMAVVHRCTPGGNIASGRDRAAVQRQLPVGGMAAAGVVAVTAVAPFSGALAPRVGAPSLAPCPTLTRASLVATLLTLLLCPLCAWAWQNRHHRTGGGFILGRLDRRTLKGGGTRWRQGGGKKHPTDDVRNGKRREGYAAGA